VPAYGKAERMGEDKLWADVGGEPLIALTLRAMFESRCLDDLVVVAPKARREELQRLCEAIGWASVQVVEGGARRSDSVAAGLRACVQAEVICVHDAARPLAPPQLFRDVVDAARSEGAAIAAIPCIDTIKQVAGTHVVATLERGRLISVQTPQPSDAGLLRRAPPR